MGEGRPTDFAVVDAHSLYLEVLAELGLIGLILVTTALLSLVVGLGRRSRGRTRSLYAALLGAILAWAVHAGVDWDWEMPVVTAWLFGLGGLGIAARKGEPQALGPAPLTRIAAAIGCLILAVTPALAAAPRSGSMRASPPFVATTARLRRTPRSTRSAF